MFFLNITPNLSTAIPVFPKNSLYNTLIGNDKITLDRKRTQVNAIKNVFPIFLF